MPSTFELYKPLRNLIRYFELEESLEVCRQLSNYLNLSQNLPSSIEIEPRIRHSNNPILFRTNVIGEWELEFLVSEIVLNSPGRVIDRKMSLNNRRDRERCINHIRRIRDNIESFVISNSDIFLEMNRISHQQFIWQSGFSYTYLYKYFKIFSERTLDQLILSKIGLSTFDIINTGIKLFGHFSLTSSLNFPITTPLYNINTEIINSFLTFHSLTIESHRTQINAVRKYDETLLYRFNPMRKTPIILYNSKYFMPFPKLIYWQITSGIYYSIINGVGFDNSFGIAFQSYLIELITVVNSRNRLTIYPERVYGNPEKRTADIIIEDNESYLFIECKTKKMTWKSKESIADTLDLEIDLEIISNAFYQIYKTASDFINDQYPHLPHNSTKNIYVMVVTLEDWYVGYNNLLYDKLRDNILASFITDNKSAKITMDIPYFFFSSEEFEKAVQVMESIGIKTYFDQFRAGTGHDTFNNFQYHKIFEEEATQLFLSH